MCYLVYRIENFEELWEEVEEHRYAGKHLVLDCVLTEESLPVVSSREHVAQYLENVTEITGMTLVMPPIALKFPYASETHKLAKKLTEEGWEGDSEVLTTFNKHLRDRDTNGSGVSAISMWLESHSSVHGWSEYKYQSIDLFSCKNYEVQPVLEHTFNYFKLDKIFVTEIDRYMDKLPDIKQFEYSLALA